MNRCKEDSGLGDARKREEHGIESWVANDCLQQKVTRAHALKRDKAETHLLSLATCAYRGPKRRSLSVIRNSCQEPDPLRCLVLLVVQNHRDGT